MDKPCLKEMRNDNIKEFGKDNITRKFAAKRPIGIL